MNVMLVLANGGPGGMQRQVALLANGLAERGHEVVVVVGGEEAVAGLKTSGVTLCRISEFRGRSGGLAFLRALRRLVRRHHPAVLHGHGLRLVIALRIAQQRDTVTLVTSHGIDPNSAQHLSWPLRLARVQVASCGAAPERILEGLGISSIVLPVGIEAAPTPKTRAELHARFAIVDDAPVAIAAIRLSEQKDPATLVAAVADVDDLHLVIFGEGPLLEATRMLAQTLGASHRIHFAGYDREVRAWMAAGDLVILSSRWEGHVLVALEAMAAGVPFVSTSCLGVVEWVSGDESALLSPVGDSAALAGNVRRVLGSAQLAQTLREGGLKVASDHGVSEMVARHLKAYGLDA